jgi:hypothetical protein
VSSTTSFALAFLFRWDCLTATLDDERFDDARVTDIESATNDDDGESNAR